MSKNILVTGASRGIGEQIVNEFSKNENYTIYALSRNVERMHKSFNGLVNVHPYKLDLCQNIQSQIQPILNKIDSIDILVNNAGLLIKKPFNEITKNDLIESYQVNVFGIIESIQLCLNHFKKNTHILNISSMGGFQGSVKFPELTAYSSSKAAICNVTEMFAEEYKNSGIKINCLCLGAIQTEMLKKAFPDFNASINANEMAKYICDFAENGHRFYNGAVLPVSLSTP